MTPASADGSAVKIKNLRRVAAGRISGRLRRPWRPEDLQRLRQQCLERRPWQHATGPRTQEGRQQSRANGKRHEPNPDSLRQIKAEVMDVSGLISLAADLRRSLSG